jgi:hypothetical protein
MKPSNPTRPRHHPLRLVVGSLVAGLLLLAAGRALASDETSTLTASNPGLSFPNAYLSLGLGATSVGPMATVSLSVDVGPVLFMARASTAAQFTVLSPPASAIEDYSGLIGLLGREGLMRGYMAVGLGWANTTLRGEQLPATGDWSFPSYEMQRLTVLNVPVQVGFSADCGFAGIGLALFGNVNHVVPEVGVALTMSLGKMHD